MIVRKTVCVINGEHSIIVDKVAVGNNPETVQSSSTKLSCAHFCHADLVIFVLLTRV
jgi:hypothetical protein